MNTAPEIFLIDRLAQVTNDAIRQSAGPVHVIGVGGDENCRNGVARLDEMSEKFDPRHRRHMDVGDQAGCFNDTWGREEVGRRRESIDAVAQGSQQPPHGLAKGRIVFNDRHQ